MEDGIIMNKKIDIKKVMESYIKEVESRPFPPKSKTETLNCLSYWYPKIIANNARTPKTKIVSIDYKESFQLFNILDGTTNKTITDLEKKLQLFIEEIGVPCFLRTGQTSDKHRWKRSCLIAEKDTDYIHNHVGNLIDTSGCYDLPIDVWCIREMLPTIPLFYAFSGMPITKERRYFVENGKVKEHFPYWPERAILDNINEKLYPDWKNILKDDNVQSEEEINILTKLSESATIGIEGYWSIDWLWTKDGWYCIDMALGECSYHYGKDNNNIHEINN